LNICFVTIGIPSALSSINAAIARLAAVDCRISLLSGRRSAARMLSRHCRFAQFDQQTLSQYTDPQDTESSRACPSLIDWLGKIAPDLVLIDSEMHSEQIQAEAAGFRVAAIEYHVSPDRVRGIPPLSSAFVPSNSLRDRVRCYRIWRQLDRHRRNRPELQAYFQSLADLCTSQSRDYHALADHGHWQPVRFKHIPILRVAPLALDLPHQEPAETRFYSPTDTNTAVQAADEMDPDGSLQDWIANRKRRLVVCTAGSLIHDTRFTEAYVELARHRDDLDFLVAGITADTMTAMPANIRAVRLVPQSFALRFADFMLSGAGIATIIESVERAVPLIVVSHGVLDQNGNAARVVHHGLGERIANRQISAVSLNQGLNHLEEAGLDSVRQMSQALKAESDADSLIGRLRELVAAGSA